MEGKLAILGFGRSGTTWISDVISRCLNSMILFEPMHPTVNYDFSLKMSYSSASNDRTILANYLNEIYKDPLAYDFNWLYRNHLPFDNDVKVDKDHYIIDQVVKLPIIGFKDIRLNFRLEDLLALGYKVIYVKRWPTAVIASILGRNFWEFKHPGLSTFEVFQRNSNFDGDHGRDFKLLYDEKYTENDDINNVMIKLITHMWAYTEQRFEEFYYDKLPSLPNRDNFKLVYYDQLYLDPFNGFSDLIKFIDGFNVNVHPSTIFSPSVTTTKSFHARQERVNIKTLDMFNNVNLDTYDIFNIYDIISSYNLRLKDEYDDIFLWRVR